MMAVAFSGNALPAPVAQRIAGRPGTWQDGNQCAESTLRRLRATVLDSPLYRGARCFAHARAVLFGAPPTVLDFPIVEVSTPCRSATRQAPYRARCRADRPDGHGVTGQPPTLARQTVPPVGVVLARARGRNVAFADLFPCMGLRDCSVVFS